MTIFEIRANIKFLTKLNRKPVQIMKAPQNVYGNSMPYVEQSITIGLNALKTEERNLKTTHGEGDPAQQKFKKTSVLCKI